MPGTKEPVKSTTARQRPDNGVYLVVLSAPNRQTLAKLLRDRLLDVGPANLRPDTKEIEVHLYLTERQIAQLKKEGWKLEVHENLSEVGRARQKEVGKGDRFEGGRIPPKGLGKKTGKEL